MEQMQRAIGERMVSLWFKSQDRPYCVGRINEVQGSTEKSGQGLRKGCPFCKRASCR